MGPRRVEHSGGGDRWQEAVLLHPAGTGDRRCGVAVTSRGLVLRPVAGRPDLDVRVPWWTVEGFAADGTAPGPDGRPRQVLTVVTDAGTLSLRCSAATVSELLARIGRRSTRWRLSRRPPAAAMSRIAASLRHG
ncbi:MAG: hypothetical protein ACRDY3_13745 [Acidimicrobiales bacterium]